MITRLDVLLEISPEEFDYNTGSVLHGLLMEEADSAYVDYLHESAMNPFSQMVFRNDKNQVVWRINTLDKAAEENIINLIENKQRLFIKKRNKEIAINKISKQTFSYKELISKY